MGLMKVKCNKCGEIFDEDEIANVTVSVDGKIYVQIECPNCGKSEEIIVKLPKFLRILEG